MEGNYWSRWSSRRVGRRSVVRGGGLAAAGTAAWALAGCGGDDDKASPATTAAAGGSPAAGASAAAAAQPRKGGQVTYSIGGEPPNFDVHKTATAYVSGYGNGAAYSNLLKPQSTGHKNALIAVGDLAEKWEQPDKTTVVFTLRGNAKFHNIAPVNGRAVTADDVVFSFKRQIAEKANASLLAGMKDITAVDPKTVKITLEAPNVDFVPVLTDPHVKVVPKDLVEAKGNLENDVIGSGPWIFKEWKKGSSITLVRNPDYFLPNLPYADTLFMPVIKDQAQIEAQFMAGQLTMARVAAAGQGIPPKRMDSLDKKKYGVYKTAPISGNWVLFGQGVKPFEDVRVRQALAIAIDRELIIGNVLENQGILDALGMAMPGPDWRLSQEELKKLLAPDPKKARQLLDAAGGAAAVGKQVMPAYESPATLNMAQLVQANWKALGVETEIQSVDNVGLNNNIYNPATAKYGVATSAISHAPVFTADLQTWFTAKSSRNSMKINDPDLDALILKQSQEFDEKVRRQLVIDLQKLMIDKAYIVSLAAGIDGWAYPLNVHNVEPPPGTGTHQFFAEIWMDA